MKYHHFFGFVFICSIKGRYKQVDREKELRKRAAVNSVNFLYIVQFSFAGFTSIIFEAFISGFRCVSPSACLLPRGSFHVLHP